MENPGFSHASRREGISLVTQAVLEEGLASLKFMYFTGKKQSGLLVYEAV